MADENVQAATILYNARVVTWRQMKELDKVLDEKPTSASILKMVELRIQNLLAFDELKEYNDTGTFRFKHPLIHHRSERAELERLLRSDPQEFLRRHRCVHDNIRRYENYIRNPDKASKASHYKSLLQRHRDKDLLFKSILESIKK